MDATINTKWNPVERPWRVTFYHRDNSPGMFGWNSRTYTFDTLDQALTVAAMPMSGQYKVAVDCAKERETWGALRNPKNEDCGSYGYWEPVLSRKTGKKASWSKGWSAKRAEEIAQWYATKELKVG